MQPIAHTETNAAEAAAITGISESVILSYFETLNAADFQATAALFAEKGVLYPPFDSPLVGSEAIADYLGREAVGLQLMPEHGRFKRDEHGQRQYEIYGKVHTPFFAVNVAWFFALNQDSEILSVRVKLLAALHELLKLRQASQDGHTPAE